MHERLCPLHTYAAIYSAHKACAKEMSSMHKGRRKTSPLCIKCATHCNTLQHTATAQACAKEMSSFCGARKKDTCLMHKGLLYIKCAVAVCCSVLQCVAACCSVLQCVAVCCTFDAQRTFVHFTQTQLLIAHTGNV